MLFGRKLERFFRGGCFLWGRFLYPVQADFIQANNANPSHDPIIRTTLILLYILKSSILFRFFVFIYTQKSNVTSIHVEITKVRLHAKDLQSHFACFAISNISKIYKYAYKYNISTYMYYIYMYMYICMHWILDVRAKNIRTYTLYIWHLLRFGFWFLT